MSNLCPVCRKNELLEEGCNSLSRIDNDTEICDECGTQEALNEFYRQDNRGYCKVLVNLEVELAQAKDFMPEKVEECKNVITIHKKVCPQCHNYHN